MTTTDKRQEDFVEIAAPSGRVFKYFNVCGLNFPEELLQYYDPRPNVVKLSSMKVRDDDVFICGFLRSGTNWLWEIVHMLMQGKAIYQKDRKDALLLEFLPQDDFDKMDSPRIIPSHLQFEYLPKEIFKKNCKLIYVQRNPKDVALSHFNFRNSEIDVCVGWEDYLYMFLETREDCYNSWFGTTKSWQKAIKENSKDLSILLIYYEDMKKDPTGEITKLAKFLDVQTDQKFLSEIVEKISFANMKKAKLQYLSEKIEEYPELQDTTMNSVEKRTQYYRKGEVGDWKNQFTVSQSEYFDRVLSVRMKDTLLQLKYSV